MNNGVKHLNEGKGSTVPNKKENAFEEFDIEDDAPEKVSLEEKTSDTILHRYR